MDNNSPNPYKPPETERRIPQYGGASGTPVPAGKWLRFGNVMLDYIGMLLVFIVFCLALMLLTGADQVAIRLENVNENLLGVVLSLGYYLGFEATFGYTPAKLITGTRVVNEQGQQPSFQQILGRSAARLIPFDALSFLGPTGRGWHDSLSGTYVIDIRNPVSANPDHKPVVRQGSIEL